MTVELCTGRAPTRDGVAPSTDIIHVSAGPEWVGSEHLGWLHASYLDDYVHTTADGDLAAYEPIPYKKAGMTYAQLVVGRFVVNGEPVAWAWRYYR